MINCSSSLLAKMNHHQIIDCLILTDLKADHMRFLTEVLQNSTVRQLLIPKKATAYFKRLIKESGRSISTSHTATANLQFTRQINTDGYSFTLQDSNSTSSVILTLSREVHHQTHLALEYRLKKGTATSHKFVLNYANSSSFVEFHLYKPMRKVTSK